MKGIKGNGISLGLTDGTLFGALTGGSDYAIGANTNYYGANTGSTNYSNTWIKNTKAFGITNDISKSGIEAETNSNIHYVIKY